MSTGSSIKIKKEIVEKLFEYICKLSELSFGKFNLSAKTVIYSAKMLYPIGSIYYNDLCKIIRSELYKKKLTKKISKIISSENFLKQRNLMNFEYDKGFLEMFCFMIISYHISDMSISKTTDKKLLKQQKTIIYKLGYISDKKNVDSVLLLNSMIDDLLKKSGHDYDKKFLDTLTDYVDEQMSKLVKIIEISMKVSDRKKVMDFLFDTGEKVLSMFDLNFSEMELSTIPLDKKITFERYTKQKFKDCGINIVAASVKNRIDEIIQKIIRIMVQRSSAYSSVMEETRLLGSEPVICVRKRIFNLDPK